MIKYLLKLARIKTHFLSVFLAKIFFKIITLAKGLSRDRRVRHAADGGGRQDEGAGLHAVGSARARKIRLGGAYPHSLQGPTLLNSLNKNI
jgi:hypothetical protein